MRCIHTSCVRVRSVSGAPVSSSRKVMTRRVGSPGRTSSGSSYVAATPASAASTGGTSVVIIVLIDGRIVMPVPCSHSS